MNQSIDNLSVQKRKEGQRVCVFVCELISFIVTSSADILHAKINNKARATKTIVNIFNCAVSRKCRENH